MLKALILWVFSATVALGGVAFGFHTWAELESREIRDSKVSELKSLIKSQQDEFQRVIDNLETLYSLKAYIGLNRSNVPLYRGKKGKLNLEGKEVLKHLGSFLFKHIRNSSYGIYQVYPVVDEVSQPQYIFVRNATESEKIEVADARVIAYFVPRKKVNLIMDIGNNQFIKDTSNSTFSQNNPDNKFLTKMRTSEDEFFDFGDMKFGGDFLIRQKMPGVNIELYAISNYDGWKTITDRMLKQQNWQIMLVGLGLGLMLLLGGLLYHADGMGILEKKIGEFELRFGMELEKILNQQLTKERMEAHRDISEGVHSVLKSPISAIRSDVAMFLVGVTQEQLTEKAEDINKQLDRIEKFIESLRQSNNPGQISQAKCRPKEVLEALLPDWEIDVKKYGAQLNRMILDVGEVSLPERDVKAIFKNILQFQAERVKQNMYEKNVTVRMEQDQQGLHFSIVDNMKIENEDISKYKEHMALAIAIGTLERNYASLNIELIAEGGLQMSFDLAAQQDQNLDSLTMVSMKLDGSD